VCGAKQSVPSEDEPIAPNTDVPHGFVVTISQIMADGSDGLTCTIAGSEGADHIIGRSKGELRFQEDQTIEERHARLYWDNGGLWVEDLGSMNGIYVRISSPAFLLDGDQFIAGEQLFRYEPYSTESRSVNGVEFTGSSIREWNFRLVQILEGGREGAAWMVSDSAVTLGRDVGPNPFRTDRFMSQEHCTISIADGVAQLRDLQSRNGTFVRIKKPRRLKQDDSLFIGQQLLSVHFPGS
tara:strand:+ start:3904 stop:4620 length:717 start_codon:yes stop_codon:yes gene_type:complete